MNYNLSSTELEKIREICMEMLGSQNFRLSWSQEIPFPSPYYWRSSLSLPWCFCHSFKLKPFNPRQCQCGAGLAARPSYLEMKIPSPNAHSLFLGLSSIQDKMSPFCLLMTFHIFWESYYTFPSLFLLREADYTYNLRAQPR